MPNCILHQSPPLEMLSAADVETRTRIHADSRVLREEERLAAQFSLLFCSVTEAALQAAVEMQAFIFMTLTNVEAIQ